MDLISILVVVGIFVSWGVGSFLAKLAADKIGTQSVFWDTIGYIPVLFIYSLIFLKFKNIILQFQTEKTGAILALLAGAIGSLGAVGFYFLLTRTDVSVIVPLTALYPALTAVLAIVFLHESINLTKISGIILSLIAIYLLSK